MNFVVNKTNSTVKVTREFTAPQDIVWATWTQSELLDKWVGSKTMEIENKINGF